MPLATCFRAGLGFISDVSGNVITTTLGNATCPAWLLAANGTGTGAGLLSGMDAMA